MKMTLVAAVTFLALAAALAVVAKHRAREGQRLIGCKAQPPYYRDAGSSERRTVALLIPDGPSQWTAGVLDVLAQRRVHATFAPVGKWVAGQEDVLQRMLAEGDAIGNHTFDHVDVSKTGGYREIRADQAAIRDATGYTPCVFRPPYGEGTPHLVRQARLLGLNTIGVGVDPQDWAEPGSDVIYRRVVSRVYPGAIVLLHAGPQTIEALPRIIATLRARHYSFRTLPQLLRLPRRFATG